MNELVFLKGEDALTVFRDIQEFNQSEKSQEKDPFGIVYLAELEEGLIKIGRTCRPQNRISAIKQSYGRSSIGRIAITPMHRNYSKNENLLHKKFHEYEEGKELFRINFEEAVKAIQESGLEFDCDYENTQKEREKSRIAISDFIEELLCEEFGINRLNNCDSEDLEKRKAVYEEYAKTHTKDELMECLFLNEEDILLEWFFPLTEQEVIEIASEGGPDDFVFDLIECYHYGKDRKAELFEVLMNTTKDQNIKQQCKARLEQLKDVAFIEG